jgi:hypothetical protein
MPYGQIYRLFYIDTKGDLYQVSEGLTLRGIPETGGI